MKICELAIHDMQSVKCQEILGMERERKGINFLQWIYTNVTYLLFYSFFLSVPQLLHRHSFFLFQFPSSFSFICQYLSMYFKDITFSIFLLILLYFFNSKSRQIITIIIFQWYKNNLPHRFKDVDNSTAEDCFFDIFTFFM